MAQTVFLTIDLATGKAVQSLTDARKAVKELTDELFKLKLAGKGIGDKDFDAISQKIKTAKGEIENFNK